MSFIVIIFIEIPHQSNWIEWIISFNPPIFIVSTLYLIEHTEWLELRMILLVAQDDDADEVAEDAEAAGDDGQDAADQGDCLVIVVTVIHPPAPRLHHTYQITCY